MISQTIEHPVLINPDLYRRGFKDGCRSVLSGRYGGDRDYLSGWREGFKRYESKIPACQEAPLERGAHDELLNPI